MEAFDNSTPFVKTIQYDRATRDYSVHVNGNLLGYYSSYTQAEVACNEYVYDQLVAAALNQPQQDLGEAIALSPELQDAFKAGAAYVLDSIKANAVADLKARQGKRDIKAIAGCIDRQLALIA